MAALGLIVFVVNSVYFSYYYYRFFSGRPAPLWAGCLSAVWLALFVPAWVLNGLGPFGFFVYVFGLMALGFVLGLVLPRKTAD